ncbi:MAG: amidohydrolase family protein [Bacteroidia bacterium]|nr:amidohydrolase family protein [Bacteroidia bacterium]
MKKTVLLLVFGWVLSANAQTPTPAPPQKKSIILMGGYAHIGNGQVIENSAIGFRNGKLDLVGDATTIKIDLRSYDTVINLQGKHVYPGFILANNTIGLSEIGAVRSTNDIADVGSMVPHVRSLIAYNTDSKIIPTVRTNGVLLAQVCPRGNVLSGTSSVFKLDGWNWEDAVLKADEGVHLNWPSIFRRAWWEGTVEKNKDYDKNKENIERFFADARAYSEGPVTEKNIRFEAMRGLFTGSQTLYIHANYIKELVEAIYFSKKAGVKRMVIVGGKDSWMVTDLLKENNVAVMLNRVHDLPDRPEDDVDLPYKTPSLLRKAGVLFCIQVEGDMEQIQGRNLPFNAGTAVAHGLTYEEGVMAISLNVAIMLGIDHRTGSLETGKDATLFVSTGDALDVLTNNVTLAFIEGRNIDLDNEQKFLYNQYMKKYGK